MDIKEFRTKGYLQEINRRFLHPLGLALEITIDDNTDKEYLSGIWDYRDDPDGLIFDLANSSDDRKESFKDKRDFINNEFDIRLKTRITNLGFDIEPI
jgi:hypothetical protein